MRSVSSSRVAWASAVLIASLAAATLAVGPAADQPPPDLAITLARAARYVAFFIDRFSNVVSEERYRQEEIRNQGFAAQLPRRGPVGGLGTPGPSSNSRRRELKSDFLLVKNPEPQSSDWMPFRDVFEVNGAPVRDREQRLTKLFLQSSETAIEQAKQISNESTRYNLGNVQRTINTPLFTLAFLQAHYQPRFAFTVGKQDRNGGPNVWILDYKEQLHPTVITGIRGRDVLSRGRLWVDADTGRVLRTEMLVDDPNVRASVTVTFRNDDRFQINVPVEMDEHYWIDRSEVLGNAHYGRFRRFDVSADETIHKPTMAFVERRTGINLIEISPGHFMMGSPPSELGHNDDETEHDVTIGRPYFIGQREITQQEWRTIMGSNPSASAQCGGRCPVEHVTFEEVRQFLDKLNAQPNAEYTFRLPTEAEWEYACRAGKSTPFATGDSLTSGQANIDGKQPYGASAAGLFRGRPVRVGGFPANAWGLTDMHGNVWEWLADRYGPYSQTNLIDPAGASSGETRVVRGGSWKDGAASARCGARAARMPTDRDPSIGFRVAADKFTPAR